MECKYFLYLRVHVLEICLQNFQWWYIFFIVQSFCPTKLLDSLHFLQLFHQFQQLCRLHQELLKQKRKDNRSITAIPSPFPPGVRQGARQGWGTYLGFHWCDIVEINISVPFWPASLACSTVCCTVWPTVLTGIRRKPGVNQAVFMLSLNSVITF